MDNLAIKRADLEFYRKLMKQSPKVMEISDTTVVIDNILTTLKKSYTTEYQIRIAINEELLVFEQMPMSESHFNLLLSNSTSGNRYVDLAIIIALNKILVQKGCPSIYEGRVSQRSSNDYLPEESINKQGDSLKKHPQKFSNEKEKIKNSLITEYLKLNELYEYVQEHIHDHQLFRVFIQYLESLRKERHLSIPDMYKKYRQKYMDMNKTILKMDDRKIIDTRHPLEEEEFISFYLGSISGTINQIPEVFWSLLCYSLNPEKKTQKLPRYH